MDKGLLSSIKFIRFWLQNLKFHRNNLDHCSRINHENDENVITHAVVCSTFVCARMLYCEYDFSLVNLWVERKREEREGVYLAGSIYFRGLLTTLKGHSSVPCSFDLIAPRFFFFLLFFFLLHLNFVLHVFIVNIKLVNIIHIITIYQRN